MIRNPILKANVTIFGFWWLVMTVIALFQTPFGQDTAETIGRAILLSLGVTVTGFGIGFFGRIAWRSGRGIVAEKMLLEGDQWNGAISLLGRLPSLEPPAMAEIPASLLAKAPWLAPMEKKFPLHAAAAKAVLRVMLTEPTLPASPVPGGHGGRTLIEHSFGVVESMLEEAPKWTYRGQFKRDGKTLAVPPRNGPHRFAPEDFGLLILTALAHDIGKITCYKLQKNGRIVEVKPNHDTEGAKLLRRLPEVMALPLADRRALITACAYYHHPFGMPLVEWCDDRVRSLTELLIVADHATGKKEGHSLTSAQLTPAAGAHFEPEGQDEEAAIPVVDRQAAAAIGAAFGVTPEEMETGGTLFDADDAMSAAGARAAASLARGEIKAGAEVPPEDDQVNFDEDGAAAKSGRAEIVGLFHLLREKKDLINHSSVDGRMAFKRGKWLYIAEPRLRAAAMVSSWNTGFSSSELNAKPQGRDTNPFTRKVLEALAASGYLLQEIDHALEKRRARFNPISAVFRIRTQAAKSKAVKEINMPFIVVPAAPFGAGYIRDWPYPIEISTPFWGWNSEAGKLKATPVSAAEEASPWDRMEAYEAKVRDEEKEDADSTPVASAGPPNLETPADYSPAGQTDFDDDLPSGMGASAPEKMSQTELLSLIRIALEEAELAPARVMDNGDRVYYADGNAARIINGVLNAEGADEAAIGLRRTKAASGRDLIILPAQ